MECCSLGQLGIMPSMHTPDGGGAKISTKTTHFPLFLFFSPTNSKDYIHRVGRTARAGRAGKSITMVCQYDVEIYQKIEAAIGKKLEEWPHEKDQIMVLKERVDEAKRIAEQEIKVTC